MVKKVYWMTLIIDNIKWSKDSLIRRITNRSKKDIWREQFAWGYLDTASARPISKRKPTRNRTSSSVFTWPSPFTAESSSSSHSPPTSLWSTTPPLPAPRWWCCSWPCSPPHREWARTWLLFAVTWSHSLICVCRCWGWGFSRTRWSIVVWICCACLHQICSWTCWEFSELRFWPHLAFCWPLHLDFFISVGFPY